MNAEYVEYVGSGAALRPRPDRGRCAATVGDGLVPSRAKAAAVPGMGGDKPRPYGPSPTPPVDGRIRSMRGRCPGMHGR